jgi:anti-sigma factor RsiW
VNCEEATTLIHAHADGELDLAHALEVDRHLAECAACAQRAEQLRALRAAISGANLRYMAPPQLRERIRSALPATVVPTPVLPWFSWRYVATATALAAAVLLIALPWAAIWWKPTTADQFAQEVVSNHVRSLLADHLLDVASEDKHTVKPWFAGRLDFAPQVADLKDHDFPLAGGRLDVLDGRPVAALVYKRGKHVINLFVHPVALPAGESRSMAAQGRSTTYQGFHVVNWTEGGLEYVAVSDLNEIELREFANLIQAATTEKPSASRSGFRPR